MEYSERECWREKIRQLAAENERLKAENVTLRERLIDNFRKKRHGQ